MSLYGSLFLLTSLLLRGCTAQEIASDPGVRGPAIELVHSYYGQMPNAVAVSSKGRIFSTYPSGLDANNTAFQVAEIKPNVSETPFPNAAWNMPPNGYINTSTTPATGVGDSSHFINCMSVAIDPLDRLWILDNGRPLSSDGTLVPASPGGPKLVAVNLTSNEVALTIVLPPTAAYPDSYLNDVRIDLRANVTESGQGIAYITDSSSTGRNAIVVVDIGTQEAWRHLEGHPSVRPTEEHFKQVWGEPVYSVPGPNMPFSFDSTGIDGLAFTQDADTLFWSVTGSRYLYSIPTERLRDRSQTSEIRAQAAVTNHGEKGCSDGLMQDTNNYVYAGSFEQNAINVYNSLNGTVTTYVRDPRIGWTDSMWIANDQNIYFIQNQLWRTKSYFPGTDRRVKPYTLWRVPTADGGKRVSPHFGYVRDYIEDSG